MKPQYTFQVDGENIPYYHFHYEKEFNEVLRIRGKRNYFKDGSYLPEFIKEETLKQYDFNQNYPVFEKVMILIFHNFAEFIQRDLDNYSYKPFIDIIRKLQIVQDDSYDKVSIMNMGSLTEDKESIDFYVIPLEYYPYFLSYDTLWNCYSLL